MIQSPVDTTTRRRFTTPLLKWYRLAGRDLPWRTTQDAYRIWLSEIMLQQTQVVTVLPYYHQFLETFPTIKDLAEADLEAVLKQWQGLGYYARARHLHKAAQILVSQFSAKMPDAFEAILGLPGIGRSTAGAISTIAHGKRYPILDGNVRRVLCRFFAIEKDPRDKAVNAWLWRCSEQLMPRQNASQFLQAIMDFGATVCTPKQPNCHNCSLESDCVARKKGLQAAIPLKAISKKIPHYDYFAGLLCAGDTVLIRRRPLRGLLAGLWEFPGERIEAKGEKTAVKVAYERFFCETLNIDVNGSKPYLQIKHVFTHFKMTLHVFLCHLEHPVNADLPLKWVERELLAKRPFSSAHQKIVLQLGKNPTQGELF